MARYSGKPVINAGDGRRAHPTQALLDAYTVRREFGTLEGKTVAIIGDVRHSRVARSNAELLPKLGAKVILCGPATLLPRELAAEGVTLTTDPREAVRNADAVMALRLQQERMDAGYVGSLQDYAQRYQVNDDLLAFAPDRSDRVASGADEQRRGDQQRDRRRPAQPHSGAGGKRAGSADEHAVSPAGGAETDVANISGSILLVLRMCESLALASHA